MFQRSFKGVLRKIEGCSKSPLWVINGSFKVSKRSLKGVSREFQRRFKKVLSVLKEFLKSFIGKREVWQNFWSAVPTAPYQLGL